MKVKQRSVCQTCRDRKLGCDGKRPTCSQCVLRGRTCEGYQSEWTFIEPKTPRRPSNFARNQKTSENTKFTADKNYDYSARCRPRNRKQVDPERTRSGPSLSLIQLHSRPFMNEIAGFVKHSYLPEILNTLGNSERDESRVCGVWVEVLPMLPCLASDTSVLSKSIRALATLINSRKTNSSRVSDVESPQSYQDAIHTMRGNIAANGLSFELLPAIMCLTLVELMLPDSVAALKMHLRAIAKLFENYGPRTFESETLHQLFLGFRPLIIAEAFRDRQPTFLATSAWINIPFSVNAPSRTQGLYSQAASIPSILQQIDLCICRPSSDSHFQLQESMQSLLETWRRLCNWEQDLGFHINIRIRSMLDVQSSAFNILLDQPNLLGFPNISIANGLTHCWSFQIVCLLEMDKILSRLLANPGILDSLSEEINPLTIRAEGDRLAFWICASMSYLLQDEMKLFGPASALFPAQIAFAWFETHRVYNQNEIDFIKVVVAQLVSKGLLSAPRLVLGEDLI